ncbi:MAG TPA: tRNA (adenosine(37)-N6)-threonylcarbamoyltransferase complex transferase subunit TsaD [Bacteroidales bacterium]|jgi:N6-L-threonylcarbamoyladenine synthase|nr:tRNA (adenosine(37)-N6)-threonylcarbamoyltransferase complex transferase subunit TsaD [Bacteroidales bacterium]HRR03721.1 tRNA (adenosine(37)-N6)-threonylcarbamoyltransferase complex transferase subunit TsaD [Bacteroidales bacterium]HRT13576.1 tRNA (adenosine(37)-N6)-threonylcarbamoyltransferase complex transferase subunit TsaD [Bacteroidales bacterium]HXK74621.1 tRNA (adenosine(37)-N6)-threonylcarbamoyltransferase complex transferase subunit TsaD [Bacteroidales bacterium]
MSIYILGIESSCDDTSASVIANQQILSNVIASQKVHSEFGGVIPELASRAHQHNIIPVIDTALKRAKINKKQLNAIAYTNGPGLLGSLLVGSSFAKAMALALNIPLIEVDHLQGHVLSVFLEKDETKKEKPQFPFLCLTVSGGHTLLLKVHDYFDMQVVGKTIDDAAGEAFDKAAKILGLPYPGGPVIDKLASAGNPLKFQFSMANLPNFDFSFSGLKTSFLYFVRDQLKNDKQFIEKNLADLAASIQFAIIQSLTKKMKLLLEQDKCKDIVLAGGVSANSGLRVAMKNLAKEYQRNIFLPDLDLTTDNAAMIAISGYFKYLKQEYSSFKVTPYSSSKI